MSPFLYQEQRELYDNYELAPPEDGAALNYVLCRLLARFTEYHGISYATLSQAGFAMVGAFVQYLADVVLPYEAIKKGERGDVWGTIPEMLEEMRSAVA